MSRSPQNPSRPGGGGSCRGGAINQWGKADLPFCLKAWGEGGTGPFCVVLPVRTYIRKPRVGNLSSQSLGWDLSQLTLAA